MIDVKQIEFRFSCACIDMRVIAYIHMIIKLRKKMFLDVRISQIIL